MEQAGERARRAVIYCLVPRELADKLHEPLRRHFRARDESVEVVVEQRRADRRAGSERRRQDGPRELERRKVRSPHGLRVADRRASAIATEAPALPRRIARFADHLVFVERLEPSSERLEDLDTARTVMRFQLGDADSFTTLYMRYFERVYSYLRVVVRDAHAAEDSTQQVFTKLFESLHDYEHRGRPFTAWLFTVVRNEAIGELRRQGRNYLVDPVELRASEDAANGGEAPLETLGWISDRELLLFVERLPMAQRQALVLRYMLDLPNTEIAAVLGRSVDDVRQMQSRALRFLRARLSAVGRGAGRRDRTLMRSPLRKSRVMRQRRYALAGGPRPLPRA